MPGLVPLDRFEALALDLNKVGLKGMSELVELEKATTAMTVVDTNAVPELLMGEAYAEALFRYGQPQQVTATQSARQVRLHLKHQDLIREQLEKGRLESVQFIFGEWAVRDAARYEGALEYMAAAARHERIGIHVLPLGGGITRLTNQAPFTVHTLRGGHDVVTVGNTHGVKVLHGEDKVKKYRKAAANIINGGKTLSLEATLARIEE